VRPKSPIDPSAPRYERNLAPAYSSTTPARNDREAENAVQQQHVRFFAAVVHPVLPLLESEEPSFPRVFHAALPDQHPGRKGWQRIGSGTGRMKRCCAKGSGQGRRRVVNAGGAAARPAAV